MSHFPDNPILNFYNGGKIPALGLTACDIISSPNSFWDAEHNFIQYVFPNNVPSKAHPDMPWLLESDFRFLDRYLLEDFQTRFFYFLESRQDFKDGLNTHNDLRVTRMIRCNSIYNCMVGHLTQSTHLFWKIIKLVEGRKSWDVVKFWHEACEGHRVLNKE